MSTNLTDLKNLVGVIHAIRDARAANPAEDLARTGFALATMVVGAEDNLAALADPDRLRTRLEAFQGLGCELGIQGMVYCIKFGLAYDSLPHHVAKQLNFELLRWLAEIPVADTRRTAAQMLVERAVTPRELEAAEDPSLAFGIPWARLQAARAVLAIAKNKPTEETP